MAFKINPEACVSCGSCQGVCPAEAISQGDNCFVIDEAKCLSCGACASQCPCNAIQEA